MLNKKWMRQKKTRAFEAERRRRKRKGNNSVVLQTKWSVSAKNDGKKRGKIVGLWHETQWIHPSVPIHKSCSCFKIIYQSNQWHGLIGEYWKWAKKIETMASIGSKHNRNLQQFYDQPKVDCQSHQGTNAIADNENVRISPGKYF